MISRRTVAAGMLAGSSTFLPLRTLAQVAGETEVPFEQLTYPPFALIGAPEKFGFTPATEAEKAKARSIIAATPSGPTPIAIAQSFVDRFYDKDPDAISQWPVPRNWNPLVVEFFSATRTQANNDMIAWCAAFANWCLERSLRKGTRDAASQSFLNNPAFKKTDAPKVGDLVVFTCYDKTSGKSLGLGHVTFVKAVPTGDTVHVVGGNQSKDGHSSIISETDMTLRDRPVKRHVDGKYVECLMKFNQFISIV